MGLMFFQHNLWDRDTGKWDLNKMVTGKWNWYSRVTPARALGDFHLRSFAPFTAKT